MKIFKICLISIFLTSCAQTDNTAAEAILTQCPSTTLKSFQGQIRYSAGMLLKIPGCEIYNSSRIDFKDANNLRKVWVKIDLNDPVKKPHFVDLTFSGYIDFDGKLIVQNVESAEVAKEILF